MGQRQGTSWDGDWVPEGPELTSCVRRSRWVCWPWALCPAKLPGPPLSTWGPEVSEQVSASPPCSPTPSTLSGAHVNTHAPSRSPLQTQAHTAASKSGDPWGPPLPFLPPLDLPGVSVPWASECPTDEEAADLGRAAWPALAGPRACNHPPGAGLTSAWLPSRVPGRQVGLGVLRACGGPRFYTCSHWAYLQLGCTCPPRPCPSWALRPGTWGPQGLAGTWHVHAGPGRLTVRSARPPQAQGRGGESGLHRAAGEVSVY